MRGFILFIIKFYFLKIHYKLAEFNFSNEPACFEHVQTKLWYRSRAKPRKDIMELKPYFGLSEKGLSRLKKHHHHQLDTIVAQIDNAPFELPESSPIYRSRNSGSKDTKRNQVQSSTWS